VSISDHYEIRIAKLEAERDTAIAHGHFQTIELDKVRAELAIYKEFAVTYKQAHYGAMPQLETALKKIGKEMEE
jgi:hypothetical protein